ncbi:DUF2924 domain-containing protein [Kaistia soli]|uniref:DUF2924 domain-containing protein n=1 Tax=Kaistia soli TaxID=446684 RepID=UPI001FCDE01D|nr:DUF2924 domain-containing protein [Kaistia soli]
MTTSLASRLAELETMNTAALQTEWRRLFRSQPPSLSRDLLMRAIGYRYQEIAFGGLGKADARRLRTLADAAEAASAGKATSSAGDDRLGAARVVLMPGARLVREWHGRTHSVTVTDAGFDYAGRSYRSLTEIAREITGTHWSGPRFFGIGAASGKTGGLQRKGKLASAPVPRPRKAKASNDG